MPAVMTKASWPLVRLKLGILRVDDAAAGVRAVGVWESRRNRCCRPEVPCFQNQWFPLCLPLLAEPTRCDYTPAGGDSGRSLGPVPSGAGAEVWMALATLCARPAGRDRPCVPNTPQRGGPASRSPQAASCRAVLCWFTSLCLLDTVNVSLVFRNSNRSLVKKKGEI
jgi:hypothetical protein